MRTRCGWYGTGLAGVAMAMALASPAEAQHRRFDRDYEEWRQPRLFFDLGFLVGSPVGEFSDFVDDGWGLGGGLAYAVDPAGIFRLRLDGGFLVYGHERQEVCLSDRIGCRVVADLTTTNQIAYADLGAEVGVQVGPLRPYVGVARGLSYFQTSSSLSGVDDYDYDGVFNTTNFDDLVWGWKSRGGMQVQVSRGRTPLFLDFAAVFHDNGVAEYLTEGDIQDNADGSITVFPIRSEANLVTFQMGMSVGVGGRGSGDDYPEGRRPRRRR